MIVNFCVVCSHKLCQFILKILACERAQILDYDNMLLYIMCMQISQKLMYKLQISVETSQLLDMTQSINYIIVNIYTHWFQSLMHAMS